jgi:hypothetical protein
VIVLLKVVLLAIVLPMIVVVGMAFALLFVLISVHLRVGLLFQDSEYQLCILLC